jgi:hypothetical protein
MGLGAALVGLGTLLFDLGAIPPMAWMIAVSPGLYLGHVPNGCVLFDRAIAAESSAASISCDARGPRDGGAAQANAHGVTEGAEPSHLLKGVSMPTERWSEAASRRRPDGACGRAIAPGSGDRER